MDDYRKVAIDKAREIVKKYNPNILIPFPFENILKEHEDVEVFSVDLTANGFSGFIAYDDTDGKFKIALNSRDSKERAYFTKAHELGHYFLHGEEIKNYKDGDKLITDESSVLDHPIMFRGNLSGNKIFERQANSFAAELIMPEEQVRNAWDVSGGDLSYCARVFEVSLTAMAIRVEALGLRNG
ncbi:ImmA/IrrE family metallo-endopeptidase [Candidatus Saccharibacteria bacterium]|nr:ImmA/IrrE family metallo-endopeptidase [Candidatus Saccharibacteria bacterium]